MDQLRIRVYHVPAGEAFLISFPEKEGRKKVQRHILVDLGSEGEEVKEKAKYEEVIADLLKELDGQDLDLFVLSHDHVDQYKGLLFAKNKLKINLATKLNPAFTWLPKSLETKGEANIKAYQAEVKEAFRYLNKHKKEVDGNSLYKHLLEQNDPRQKSKYLSQLMKFSAKRKTHFLHSGTDLEKEKHHPFTEAKFNVLGPEKDCTTYRTSSFENMLAFVKSRKKHVELKTGIAPPVGVDASAFFNLLKSRMGHVNTLSNIDRGSNNASLVLQMEWRGWQLLFPGDVGDRAWRKMKENGALSAVHFVKLPQHGRLEAMPEEQVLKTLFPGRKSKDGRSRHAIVYEKENISHEKSLKQIARKCDSLIRVNKTDDNLFYDLYFEG